MGEKATNRWKALWPCLGGAAGCALFCWLEFHRSAELTYQGLVEKRNVLTFLGIRIPHGYLILGILCGLAALGGLMALITGTSLDD